MDKDSILNIEASNKGNSINLFYNQELAVWLAFNKSAYALRLLLKSLKYDNLRVYSGILDMPIVILGRDILERLKSSSNVSEWREKDFTQLYSKNAINEKDYEEWVEKLKREFENPFLNINNTPIGRFVPKDQFIPDNMSAFSRNLKRIIDMLCAAILMIIFSPLFLFCYIAIKSEDHGPAIFKQERIGRFGKPFFIYKFRSMRIDAEKDGPQLSHSSGNNDKRLTKIGKFLRSHHLDELPQLWNVFIGDMAFIGPRPERKFFIDQIMEYDKRYVFLYQIRPGVTSYATLYNGYTDTMEKMLRRLEYDLYYLSNRSFIFDAKILVKTFFSIIFGKKF